MLSVTVPSSYHNSTCGLCGNFDGRHHNDHLHRNDVATYFHRCEKAMAAKGLMPPPCQWLLQAVTSPSAPCGVPMTPPYPSGPS
uniref:VWFD domain-containing protein n=1 Tax=Coturnix japonica TaxID=93934 RepID=A0A8C2SW28_COTJA